MIEDHVDGEHTKLWNALNSKLGGKTYASGVCKATPTALSWKVTGSHQKEKHFRELRDGRSNLCLDVEGGNSANDTNVRLWSCNGSIAQKWVYEASNGYMRSAAGKCLDNRGQTHNDGGISIYDCVDSNNLRFDWVGNSIRSRHNRDIAVDAYGDSSGAQVGLWSYHGGSNRAAK